MYAGKNQIADMLDREIGDTIVDNEEGVKTILDKLEGWYGKENSVDLYQSFQRWKDLKRQPGQDVVEFITSYEDAYNRLHQNGEKISDKLKAMMLLESADLPYLQHNLVLSSVNLSDKEEKEAYDKVKENIRKYHSSDEIKKKSSVLLAKNHEDPINIDDIQEELEKVLVAKGWKPPPQPPSKGNTEEKRWWKCSICLCKCTPKWKKCDCECSNHKWYNCPQRNKKKGAISQDEEEKDEKEEEEEEEEEE